jgi:hypothetical protein
MFSVKNYKPYHKVLKWLFGILLFISLSLLIVFLCLYDITSEEISKLLNGKAILLGEEQKILNSYHEFIANDSLIELSNGEWQPGRYANLRINISELKGRNDKEILNIVTDRLSNDRFNYNKNQGFGGRQSHYALLFAVVFFSFMSLVNLIFVIRFSPGRGKILSPAIIFALSTAFDFAIIRVLSLFADIQLKKEKIDIDLFSIVFDSAYRIVLYFLIISVILFMVWIYMKFRKNENAQIGEGI